MEGGVMFQKHVAGKGRYFNQHSLHIMTCTHLASYTLLDNWTIVTFLLKLRNKSLCVYLKFCFLPKIFSVTIRMIIHASIRVTRMFCARCVLAVTIRYGLSLTARDFWHAVFTQERWIVVAGSTGRSEMIYHIYVYYIRTTWYDENMRGNSMINNNNNRVRLQSGMSSITHVFRYIVLIQKKRK